MASEQVWIRGSELRKRWGAMPKSTFYRRIKQGLIPEPRYPFGPATPFWHMADVEAHEQRAAEAPKVAA